LKIAYLFYPKSSNFKDIKIFRMFKLKYRNDLTLAPGQNFGNRIIERIWELTNKMQPKVLSIFLIMKIMQEILQNRKKLKISKFWLSKNWLDSFGQFLFHTNKLFTNLFHIIKIFLFPRQKKMVLRRQKSWFEKEIDWDICVIKEIF
jgi:hypothetical protein